MKVRSSVLVVAVFSVGVAVLTYGWWNVRFGPCTWVGMAAVIVGMALTFLGASLWLDRGILPRTADNIGRLGIDGTVRLPPAIIARVGLKPGDFVYFLQEKDGIRILTGEQMDATLPEYEEK